MRTAILSNCLSISLKSRINVFSSISSGRCGFGVFQFARALIQFYCSFCHVINSYVNKINVPQLVLHVIPSHAIVYRSRLPRGRCSSSYFPLQPANRYRVWHSTLNIACVCGVPTTTNSSGGQISSPRRAMPFIRLRNCTMDSQSMYANVWHSHRAGERVG